MESPLAEPSRLAIFERLMRASAENSDDLDRMVQAFSQITAETFGDLCTITLLNQHNERMHMAGLYDVDPQALSMLRNVLAASADMPRDQGPAAQVIRTGEPLLLESVPQELLDSVPFPEFQRYVKEVGISTIMSVAIKGRTGNIGSVSVSRHRGAKPYDEADLTLLTGMSLRMAYAIESGLLVESLRAQVAAASSARAALSASEERFRALFESTTLGIEIIDPFGTIMDTNRAFERMTGFSRADLSGRQFGTLQHPDDVGAVLHALTELKMTGEPGAPIENRIVRRDNGVLWVRTNFAAIQHGAGDESPAFLVALHEDVSERKQAERYFQAVLEATPEALVIVDNQGRIILVNQQMERMFGYERQEVLGHGVEMLMPEEVRGRHPVLRGEYLERPHPRPMGADMELFAVTKDGSTFPVEISLSPLDIEGTTVVVAAIRDITDRKRRQAALFHSERSLAEAQRVARLGSLAWDIASGSLDASDEALRIFGIARAEFQGAETIRERTHPDDLPRVVQSTEKVMGSQSPQEFEFRVVHPDGSVHIVQDRVAMIAGPDGTPGRILGTVRDVTEQREIEREMAELKNHLQSSAELERLRLAQDLHDGPMQELYAASYQLEELYDMVQPDQKASLLDINQQIQKSIRDLRGMARELRPPSISSFGLEKAIRSYVEDFRDKYPNINVHLSLAADRQLLPENVRITLFRVFQQALANVLRHAHATELRVNFSLDAQEVRLVVWDNGTGFNVPHNWLGFVRNGHYGLAGAAERVNALGGSLLVESYPQNTTLTAVVPWSPPNKPAVAGSDQRNDQRQLAD